MAKSYAYIGETVVGSGGTTGITFSSIPQTYTDLLLKISFRTNRAEPNDYLMLKFNSTTSGYSDKNLYKSSTTVGAEANNSTTYGFSYGLNGNTSTSNSFGSLEIYIPNYTSSNYKNWYGSGATENNNVFNQMALTYGLWSNTAAITEIYLASHDTSKSLLQYSSASLYGIKNS